MNKKTLQKDLDYLEERIIVCKAAGFHTVAKWLQEDIDHIKQLMEKQDELPRS